MKPPSDESKIFFRAGHDAGLHARDTENILSGRLFSDAEDGFLRLIGKSLREPKNRAHLHLLFQHVVSSPKAKPLPLAQIVRVFERFSDIPRMLKDITKQDIHLLRFFAAYIQKWFLAGEWVRIPVQYQHDPNAYTFFSVPAGLVNLMVKLKEQKPEFKDGVQGIPEEIFDDLRVGVRKYADDVITAALVVTQHPDEHDPAMLQRAQYIWQHQDHIRDTFRTSEMSFIDEVFGQKNSNGDLYFIKTCCIAAELIRRQCKDPTEFIPDVEMPTVGYKDGKPQNYTLFDFSNGRSKFDTMHSAPLRIPYAKWVVAYLGSKAPRNRSDV